MEHYLGTFNEPLNRNHPIIFCDVTLREGEQTPGVSFTLEEKKQLVRRLDEIGIGQIQIAHPGFHEKALEVCHEICSMDLRCKTEIMSNGMSDSVFEAVDRLNECNPDIIHSYFQAAHFQYAVWDASTQKKILERMIRVIEYIQKKKKLVNISLIDASRANKEFLGQLIETAAKAGANRIRLPDTVGVSTPDGIYNMISFAVDIVSKYNTIIGIHTHNDFGLTLANAVAGIKAGAGLVDISVNGLGDRAGNAALAELVTLLEVFYDFRTGIDIKQMIKLSRFVETISGVRLPPNKPLVGELVFSDEAELHILAQSENPFAYQGLLPEEFGTSRQTIYGKLTTEKTLEMAAKKVGRTIDPYYYPEILSELYQFAEQNKGLVCTENVLWKIVEKISANRNT